FHVTGVQTCAHPIYRDLDVQHLLRERPAGVRERAAMHVDRITGAAEEAGTDPARHGPVAETPQLAGQIVGRQTPALVKLEGRSEDLRGKVPMTVDRKSVV